MARTYLTLALAALAGSAVLGMEAATASSVVDPAPIATPQALPDGSFEVAWRLLPNGKWIDDVTGQILDELPQSLRKVAPTDPNVLGKLPDRPLPPTPGVNYGKLGADVDANDLPSLPSNLKPYENTFEKLGDDAAYVGQKTPPNNVKPPITPPGTPPGSFRELTTGVVRVTALPTRMRNVTHAVEVAAEKTPEQLPSFWKRNQRSIIGGLVTVGAMGVLIGAPLLVDHFAQQGAFDGGKPNPPDASGGSGNDNNGGSTNDGQSGSDQQYDGPVTYRGQ